MTAGDVRLRRKDALDRKIKACRKCTGLNQPRETESAPGFGSIDSPVAIVGEALCRACMKKQEPFYGGSGRVLQRCFDRANVDKGDLFITNSIHCHPPDDRDPHPHETTNCAGFLRAELTEIVQPRLVIGVGKFAKAALLLLYPEARELNWPFRVPRARSSDSAEQPYLLFPPHPYHIMTRPAPVREHYERRLARAIEWGFTLEKPRSDDAMTDPFDLSGFTGWVPFSQLPDTDVPTRPGVYVVVRPSAAPPNFLDVSPAGHFKGTDPTVPVAQLQAQWVPGAHIVYIGKANLGASGRRGLRRRLTEFRRYGAGDPVGHRGGRRIWQLADHAELLVGWRVTDDAHARPTERALLAAFRAQYGARPFGNMTD